MPEQGVPLTASFIPLQSQKAPLFYTSFLQDHLKLCLEMCLDVYVEHPGVLLATIFEV